ncbi:MAG: acyl-CoA thioesterase [Nitrososphaerales archaeon]
MAGTQRSARRVQDSALETVRLMMPQDANIQGNVYGGTIMKLMDEIAGAVAARHCRRNVVTASVDRMDFFRPVYIGNLLTLKSSVNYVGKTSLEVGVRIEAEDLRTAEVVHTGSSYLTFVALDKGKPSLVPEIIPETKDQKRRYREGRERKEQRLELARKEKTS